MNVYVFLTLLLGLVASTHGHGRLVSPAGRSTIWRTGMYPGAPKNYDDTALYCGGFQNQWSTNGGKCGVCGDPYQGPHDNEAGGKYAKGLIAARVTEGAQMKVTVQITANHKGWFEFRLCKNDDVTKRISHDCLDKNLLELVGTGGQTRLIIGLVNQNYTVTVQLPVGLTCSQCVLQWKYHTGNSWGCDDLSDRTTCGLGKGPQEEFYGCADIAISGTGGSASVVPPTVAPVPPVTVPVLSATTKAPVASATTTTKAPVATNPPKPAGVCNSHGVWQSAEVDNWCGTNCPYGMCPPTMCQCPFVYPIS